MSKQLNLDAKTICDKEFPVDFKGYSPVDVDQFLDMVIADYQTFETSVAELVEKNAELERANAALRAKVMELEAKAKVLSDDSEASSSTDILKRLARLEAAVFKNQ